MAKKFRRGERPWLTELLYALELPEKLGEVEFVNKYMPDYAGDPKIIAGNLRIKSNGRVARTTEGHVKAQRTKRRKLIEETYAEYVRLYEDRLKFLDKTKEIQWPG